MEVGCGEGKELLELQSRGFDAEGIDLNPEFVRSTRALGLKTQLSPAEKLPFPDASFDGVLSIVVFPYTNLPQVLDETSRVLKPGGTGRFVFHELGYCVKQVFLGPGVRGRLYGFRSILSGALFNATSIKWGDTVYHSRRQLRRYYRQSGLKLVEDHVRPRFLGLPVFVFHVVRKPK